MPDDEPPKKNPFVRFKQHIDERVGAGLQRVLGLPSIVSRSFALGPIPSQPSPEALREVQDTPSDPMAEGRSWPRQSREDAEPQVNYLQVAEGSKDIDGIIDSFRGSTLEESNTGWMLFLTRSPYSPLLLDRYLGWRPTATGDELSSQEDDSSLGGWSDAFDDLLRASSGLPMKDRVLSPMQKESLRLQQLLLGGGTSFKPEIGKQAEAYLWHLKQSRLDEVLFPFHDRMSYRSPQTMAEWVAQREVESDPLTHLLGWVAEMKKDEKLWQKGATEKVERVHKAAIGGTENAETEEDAYRAVERAAPKKLDNLFDLFKHIGEDEDKPRGDQGVRVISSSERMKPTWTGGTKTITKKEYVDKTGAVHTETVVSVKNADGEETSRRVRHSVRADGAILDGSQQRETRSDDRTHSRQGSDNMEGRPPSKDDKKPTGWFWSR